MVRGTVYDGLRTNAVALAAATVDFAAADTLAALARLTAASLRERPIAGLTWDGGDAESLCFGDEDGVAANAIAATTMGSGRDAGTKMSERWMLSLYDF
jgi:hypothetical protein